MDVLANVDGLFCSDLNVTDVQVVDYLLNFFRIVAWRSRESQYAEVGIALRQVADHVAVAVVACCSVGLVCKDAGVSTSSSSPLDMLLTYNDAADIACIYS